MEPIRVDAGGPGLIDRNGNHWSGDTGFSGGTERIDHVSIGNTSAEEIYQTSRRGATIEYSLPVAPGPRRVTLKFVETRGGEARPIDISINGGVVQRGFEIADAAGGLYLAVDRSYHTQSNGRITIQLTAFGGEATISAIEIE
jgi:hypothetical protein